jgi:hypothetical protein
MKNKYILTILAAMALFTAGCKKVAYEDTAFVDGASAPAKLSAMFDITQDNSGMVTIYPNGEGVAYYIVYFGDGTTASAKVESGGSVKRKYAEGNYDVKVVGVQVNGKTSEAIQKLTVSFRAPENMEVTATVDPSSAFKYNVTAKAQYETMFRVWWGEDPNEVPKSFLEGETISYTYAKPGTYIIKVTAFSGGAATTTVTKTITISLPLLLPLDFETVGQTYNWVNFDGGGTTVVNNPQSAGINTSAKVGRMVKSAGQVWGGSILTLSSPIDFSVNKVLRMKVWSPRAGAKVLLKVENSGNPGINFEREVATTVANQWEDLVFDFRTINASNSYNNIVLIFELGTMGNGTSNFTFFFDDLRQVSSIDELVLPLNFEATGLNYDFVNFGGANASVVNNPASGGINTSAKVGRMVKGAPEGWAGSFISLVRPIDFSSKKLMKVRVHAPRVGAKLLLKVENQTNGGIFFEQEVATTVANQWEDLTFDFSAINTANSYQKVVLIFDLGTPGNGSSNFTYYFDDIRQEVKPADVLGIPLNFESSTITYNWLNFDGGNASVINNPFKSGINTSNKVGKMVKGPGGQMWGGSFIELPNAINFSGSKILRMKVYAPKVGTKVLLKVENATNGGISFEKEVTTTTANAWEDLTFDFSAINAANSYHKVVVIFDLGTVGDGSANFTYHFDDIRFN